MAFGTTPKDGSATPIPLSCVYVPGVGLVALQGRLKTTDGLSNDSAMVELAPYASTTATLSNVAASVSSVTVLASNVLRRGGEIYNDSSSAMYLKAGSSASTTSFSVKIPPASLYEFPAFPMYSGIYTAVWDSATGNARVTELTA